MSCVHCTLYSQGPPHSDKEALHQRTDRVWPVASLCVDMERIHRCQGESMSQEPFCSNAWRWNYSFGCITAMVCLSDTFDVVLSDSLTFDLFVCVCASDWPIVTGAHGDEIWRPHSSHRTSSAAHHGKKQNFDDLFAEFKFAFSQVMRWKRQCMF